MVLKGNVQHFFMISQLAEVKLLNAIISSTIQFVDFHIPSAMERP
jgi:hypothetical protein